MVKGCKSKLDSYPSKGILMALETRKSADLKSSPLPVDYIKMVHEVMRAHFDESLQSIRKFSPQKNPYELTCVGEIYPQEVVVAVTLASNDVMAANTAYASMDFDPKASSPMIQELLGACIAALGSLWTVFLQNDEWLKSGQWEELLHGKLADLEDAPLEWTQVKIEKFKVFLRFDKANLHLDQEASDWLAKNDPRTQEEIEREQEEAKSLFVTGDSAKKTVH